MVRNTDMPRWTLGLGKRLISRRFGQRQMDLGRKRGKYEYLCSPHAVQRHTTTRDARRTQLTVPRMRSNDGAVDSHGRFWVGMMTDLKDYELKNEGVLFRLDPDLSLHRMIENTAISNGIGWSLDNKTMYIIDTPTRHVFAYDFDAETGAITNKRVFFTPAEGTGMPDGFAMDEEGYLWIALYSGGKVVRVSPDGELAGEVSVPAKCPTCAAFVGTNLYITSADEKGEESNFGGKLYKVNVGVKGRPKNKFRLAG